MAVAIPVPARLSAAERIPIDFPGGERVEALVADDAEKRTKGLMGIPELKPREGMLFVFDAEASHGMWMKNMLISIDMVWLNGKKEIVAIEKSLPPCHRNECPVYGAGIDSLYVVEAPSGTIDRFHLQKGDFLKFP
jgi:hypothetical protein